MDTVSPQDIVDTVRTSLLVLDMDLRVKSANRAFYNTFKVEPEATVGRPLFELGNGQWGIPELRTLLGEIVPRDGTVEGYEVGHDFPGIGVKCMRLNARKAERLGHDLPACLGRTEADLLGEDVSEAAEADAAALASGEPSEILVADGPARAERWSQVVRVPIRDAAGETGSQAGGQPGARLAAEGAA